MWPMLRLVEKKRDREEYLSVSSEIVFGFFLSRFCHLWTKWFSDSYVPWIIPSTSFFFVWNYFMSNIDLFQIDVLLFGTLILRPTFQESFPSTLLVISHEASKITAYSRLFLFCCFCKGNHVLTYFFLFLFVLFSYCSLCLHFFWICATRPSQLL